MLTALLLSDIHGRVSILRNIVKNAEYDVAFVAGDVSNYSGGAYREVLELLSQSVPLVVAVPGNVDPPEIARLGLSNVLVIHNDVVEVGRLAVAGTGGGIGFSFWGTPYLTDTHILSFIKELEEVLMSRSLVPHVFLTHTPPKMTRLDRIYSGEHVGSKIIREFLETHTPILHLCGHVHEGRGVERIGRTVSVNPGPAMAGYYSVARFEDVNQEVAVELKRA